jgi:hypothetical protein
MMTFASSGYNRGIIRKLTGLPSVKEKVYSTTFAAASHTFGGGWCKIIPHIITIKK